MYRITLVVSSSLTYGQNITSKAFNHLGTSLVSRSLISTHRSALTHEFSVNADHTPCIGTDD